jgi:hypothetical protein
MAQIISSEVAGFEWPRYGNGSDESHDLHGDDCFSLLDYENFPCCCTLAEANEFLDVFELEFERQDTCREASKSGDKVPKDKSTQDIVVPAENDFSCDDVMANFKATQEESGPDGDSCAYTTRHHSKNTQTMFKKQRQGMHGQQVIFLPILKLRQHLRSRSRTTTKRGGRKLRNGVGFPKSLQVAR